MRFWVHRSYRPATCNTMWFRYGVRGWWESTRCLWSAHRCGRSYYHTGNCWCSCGAEITVEEIDAHDC